MAKRDCNRKGYLKGSVRSRIVCEKQLLSIEKTIKDKKDIRKPQLGPRALAWNEFKKTKKIFICCDECEAEWNNPEDALKGINGTRNKHGEIEYPNIEDILREKWSVSINEHHN